MFRLRHDNVWERISLLNFKKISILSHNAVNTVDRVKVVISPRSVYPIHATILVGFAHLVEKRKILRANNKQGFWGKL